MTASEKLLMLRPRAVLALFVSHMKIRVIRDAVDPAELEKAADELRRMAWDIERGQA